MSDAIYQRNLADLLAAEREIRAMLEQERREYTKLLTRLALAHNGALFEELRRADPSVPKYWTAQDWARFFDHPPAEQAAGWTENGNGYKKELENARREIERLQREIERLITKQQQPPTEPYQPNSEIPPQSQSQPMSAPGRLLDGFVTPKIPLKFSRDLAGLEGRLWRRGAMMLYLIATQGYNAHLEIDLHIAAREGLSFRTNSTRKPMERLAEKGFLKVETLRIKGERPTALKLARLTESGKELCALLGWEVVESDWERLLRLHQGERLQEHTLAVILFAIHARRRGWRTVVMPDQPAGNTPPDVLVERDSERHLVEVELGGRDESVKWRNLAGAQGHVAICAYTPQVRQRLVNDCKLLGFSGVATDLVTLFSLRYHEITPSDPLWLERWE